jgi:hypothetical protein
MKRNYIELFLAFFLFCACNKNEIDKSIVLKIGNLEVTKYEFERNKKRELANNTNDTISNIDPKKLAEWKKQYIEKCLIIADAYSKSYDTLGSVNKQVKSVGDLMMVQKYGYLWKEKVWPSVETYRNLDKTKIDKRKKLFYFNYVAADNLNTILRITNNDTVLKNKEEFIKLKNKYSIDKSLTSGYFSIQWPFLAFWNDKDFLYNMKEGEVSKLLLSNNNYMFLLLDHIENIEMAQEDKIIFQKELEIGMQEEMYNKYNSEMEIKGHPVINDANVDIIGRFLSKGNSIFQFKDDPELIRYTINDSLRIIHFSTFMNYYSALMLRREITDKETLLSNIQQYYGNDYLTTEARKLNLYNSDIFMLDQKNFRNNVMYGLYIDTEIVRKITIDSSDIVKYYKSYPSLFEFPKTSVINLYIFDSKGDANSNSHTISELLRQNETSKTQDTTIIIGLRNYLPNLSIDMESGKGYSAEFINTLEQTKLNTLSPSPVALNNKYVLIYKQENQGKYTKKLMSVYTMIEQRLKSERNEVKLKEVTEELKNKYKIEINKIGI